VGQEANYRTFHARSPRALAPGLTNREAFETLWRDAIRLGTRRSFAPDGGAVETLSFILHNLPAIGERTVEHLSIVSVAVGIAILTGVPIGIAITQSRRTADTVLYLGSIVMTIPSIALFGVLIPILSKIGHGIGWLPAVIAAMLYAQLPIIRNTYTAIRNVDPALRSAAIGMGMSTGQRLARVEIPIALPVIIAGVRISVVINIGVTAIAAYIGAGGLGTFISRGISQSDIRQLITGALALGLLAIAADYSLLWVQKRLTPRGLAPRPLP
jgi:ABC-type proline/glycine betaine transport systems, permease component